MTLDAYLTLLDWTGRQIHRNIPTACAPILEHLDCSAETWLDYVKNFRQRLRNAAGLASSRQAYRHRPRPAQPSPQAS